MGVLTLNAAEVEVMKKIVWICISIAILCTVAAVGIQAYIYSPHWVKKQEASVIRMYEEHQEQLNTMVGYIEANEIDILECRKDGYIQVDDESYQWVPAISPVIEKLYNSKNNHIQEISFCQDTAGLSMSIDNYFPSNEVLIQLIYSHHTLENHDTATTKIAENWFLRTHGLT